MRRFTIALAVIALVPLSAGAERVNVKYRGEVDLAPFDCTQITHSSFVRRICYDRSNSYRLVELNGTYYHYCEIDSETVAGLMRAESVGKFFNTNVKGLFDCIMSRTIEVDHDGIDSRDRRPRFSSSLSRRDFEA
jgi:KTSC domain